MPKKTRLQIKLAPNKPNDPTQDKPYPVVRPEEENKILREHIDYRYEQTQKLVARLYIRHGANMKAVVRELAPDVEELKAMEWADILKRRPEIRAAIENEFNELGISDNSFSTFKKELWKMLLEGGEKERIAASKMFFKAFGLGEAEDTDKPQELPVADLNAGLKRMLGDKYNGLSRMD